MIQSLSRAMEILLLLGGAKKEYSLAELSESAALPPSTTHRILGTLCSRNFVILDKKTHLYSLGPALIALGIRASNGLGLRDVARPILEELSSRTNEDAMLMTISGRKGVILEKVDGPNYIKVVEKHGHEFELHCGGSHKTLLAFQSNEFIQNYIDEGLDGFTDITITDPKKLWEELMEIRRKGYGVSYGEYMEGVFGMGVPVFNKDGRAVASLGIVTPVLTLTEEKEELYRRELLRTAAKLSAMLGNPRHNGMG